MTLIDYKSFYKAYDNGKQIDIQFPTETEADEYMKEEKEDVEA